MIGLKKGSIQVWTWTWEVDYIISKTYIAPTNKRTWNKYLTMANSTLLNFLQKFCMCDCVSCVFLLNHNSKSHFHNNALSIHYCYIVRMFFTFPKHFGFIIISVRKRQMIKTSYHFHKNLELLLVLVRKMTNDNCSNFLIQGT